MQVDELPRQGEAEPCALDFLVHRPHLPELLEDRLLVLGGDAHAGVGDRHLHHAIVHGRSDVDTAPLGRELDRVGEQVQEHLLEAIVTGGSSEPIQRGTWGWRSCSTSPTSTLGIGSSFRFGKPCVSDVTSRFPVRIETR